MALTSGNLLVAFVTTDNIPASSTHQEAVEVDLTYQASNAYTNGTSAGKASKTAYYTATLASASYDLDLSTMLCSDGTTGFSAVRGIVVVNASATDGNALTIGNAATNPWAVPFGGPTERSVVQAGGRWVAEKPLGTTGMAVDATHCVLRLDAGANTVNVQVFVLGS